MVKAFLLSQTGIDEMHGINGKEDIPLEKKIFHCSCFVTSISHESHKSYTSQFRQKLIGKIPLAALLLRNLSRQNRH
jgi:hypothetical protein